MTIRRLLFLPVLAVLLLAGACTPVSTGEKEGDGRRQDFTAGWTFRLGDVADAAQPAYDDSEWRKLNLPHDWAIEGDFSKDNPSGTGGGALPGGVGWYRKTFTVDKADEGKRFYIDFDGVYMTAPSTSTAMRWARAPTDTSLSATT